MHKAVLYLLQTVRRRQKGRRVEAFRFHLANNGGPRKNVR